ncbi:hypothetical protein TIFTF001_012017 [Ficus carica]|uniref:FAD-binding PCMH-type domain-containing protein n=1 Tax=Ficus carica TaxID=3494 RepID=A0AA87ZZP4_FICCA|nr:hypothetical protein TIFTF001_012017 [Ficus carica]
MSMSKQLLSNVCLFLFFLAVRCAPEEPITCSSANNKNCTITNTYGAFPDRSVCRAGAVAYRTTEEELIDVIANATRRGLKIKAATRFSNSIPKLVCPGGEDGLLISTKLLNRVLKINSEAMTMTVQSGVSLRELINAAAKAGLALPYTPYWWGLTVGGLLATGSHGSTLWGKGSSVPDYVVGLTIVSPERPQMDLSKLGGLLTVIKTLMRPRFRLECLELFRRYNLATFQEEFAELTNLKITLDLSLSNPDRGGLGSPAGEGGTQIMHDLFLSNLDQGEGLLEFVTWGTGSGPNPGWGGLGSLAEGANLDHDRSCWAATKGVREGGRETASGSDIRSVTFKLQPMFKRSITYLTKNDSDLGDQVSIFGRQHEFADMTWYPSQQKVVYRVDDRTSSNTTNDGLYDALAFRPTSSFLVEIIRRREEIQELFGDSRGKCIDGKIFTFFLSSKAYGLANDALIRTQFVHGTPRLMACSFTKPPLASRCFIEDVQKLVKLEPRALCGLELYNGILMRYATASSAYLGKQEDTIDFDITYYRSRDPLNPRLYEDILEEIEQMAVFKYGGLPHWGKNRNIAFKGAINKYKNAEERFMIRRGSSLAIGLTKF